MDQLLIGQTIEGYIIRSNIGTGAMGRVYQAYHATTQSQVAIKIMQPEYADDENLRARFMREADLMSTLDHEHIVSVYGFGEWSNLLYIVMQLVKGPSLEAIMKHHHFTPKTAWQIIRPAAEALGYGHSRGVLHRDLKTANILVEKRGDGNHLLLTDFGLGKRPGLDATLTAAGISVGTPEYMAPEVVMGQSADHRSDMYSLGVMLYELMLGRLPFNKSHPQLTALAHVDDPLPTPRSLHPDFPRRLEVVVLRALEKDPAARFQSAGALARAYYDVVKTLTDADRRTCFWVGDGS